MPVYSRPHICDKSHPHVWTCCVFFFVHVPVLSLVLCYSVFPWMFCVKRVCGLTSHRLTWPTVSSVEEEVRVQLQNISSNCSWHTGELHTPQQQCCGKEGHPPPPPIALQPMLKSQTLYIKLNWELHKSGTKSCWLTSSGGLQSRNKPASSSVLGATDSVIKTQNTPYLKFSEMVSVTLSSSHRVNLSLSVYFSDHSGFN